MLSITTTTPMLGEGRGGFTSFVYGHESLNQDGEQGMNYDVLGSGSGDGHANARWRVSCINRPSSLDFPPCPEEGGKHCGEANRSIK